MYKVRLTANLGWMDAVANDIDDEVLAKCTEGAVIEADERLAATLIRKLRIGREITDKPKVKGGQK